MTTVREFRNLHTHGFARVAACTVPVAMADSATNAARIAEQVQALHDDGVDVALFPELSLSGYAIDDLLLQDVLLDAVDMDNAIPDGLDRLSGADYRPVLHISSERYTWNLDGLVGDELQAARPDSFNRVALAGGRHIDALQGGNPILQVAEYIVAGFSKPENIDAVKVLASSWINDMYDGTPPSYNSAGPASATPTLTRMN